MKFIITKTSMNWNEKPYRKAKKEGLTYLDYRAVSSLEEAKKYPWFEQWYNNGKNHREENGIIVCELLEKKDKWVIEINDLEELIDLVKEEGDIVILKSHYKEVPFVIEIYNSYRE